MRNYYKTIGKPITKCLLVALFLVGLTVSSFAQELVLEDNFDNFDPGNTEKYVCSEYWVKFNEDGNNVAYLDVFMSGDQLGIKVSLLADTYAFGLKAKMSYGSDANLLCSWNEASSPGMGDISRRVYDASIEAGTTYTEISTSSFTVETPGEYVLYVALSNTTGDCTLFVDDLVVYRGDAVPDCSAPVDLSTNVFGSMVKVKWNKPNSTEVINEGFEGDFPPANWETIVTNTYDNTVTWHKFDLLTVDPKPYEGEACAAIFFDVDPQDEWLIIPIEKGNIYLDFWFWMSDMILELKENEGFADHYYVKVSYDGGETWNILWDAVESCLGTNDWERVSLNLGDVTDNTKVAFHALSASEDGLYLNWYIDNVTVSKSDNNGKGIRSFNVYRNDVKIADQVESDIYTDWDVPLGSYDYCVTANYESCESEKSCTNAIVGEVPCNKPIITRHEITPNTNKPGTWDVRFFWDEPEYSGRDVYYYNCYLNGAMIGMWVEGNSFGQIEVPKGTYRYSVTAVYRQPDCESEQDYIDVIVGEQGDNCLPIDNVKATVTGKDVNITWSSRENVKTYSIYRAGVELSNSITATSYTDENAPDGLYDYCVIANYENGCVSGYELYSCATVKIGSPVVYTLPFEEDFSTQQKPKDWEITDLSTPKMGMVWRFNNPRNRNIEGSHFDRSFAIIDSDYYGFGQLQNTEIITPALDCSGSYSNINLSFDMQFISAGDESAPLSDAYLYISNDGGANWTQIEKLVPEYILTEDQIPSPASNLSYDITTKALGKKNVKIKWRYSAQYSLYMAIDNIVINGTVGVKNVEENSVMIYPNPSKGQINITANEDIENISIVNSAGKVCYESSSIGKDINISHLNDGVYIVRVLTQSGVRNSKLIIKK